MKATPSPPTHRPPLRPRALFGSLASSTSRNECGPDSGAGAKAGIREDGRGARRRGGANRLLHLHARTGPAVWLGAPPHQASSRARALLALAALLAIAVAGIALAWRSASEAALASAARPGVLVARPASVRVLDGDTLDVARVRIRLLHLDAPEGEQLCGRGSAWQRARWPARWAGRRRAGGKHGQWACGDAATAALATLIRASAWVECTPGGRDVYGRTLAACHAVGHGPAWWWAAGGRDGRVSLAAWMVERGWAVAYGAPKSTGLKALEQGARSQRRGVWVDDRFERPDAWRRKQKQQQAQKVRGV